MLLAGAAATALGSEGTPLLDDARFERGLRVWNPAPGAHREQGIIQPPNAPGPPVWGAAQWHSRFSLAKAPAEDLPSGGRRFFDGAKTVVFGTAKDGFDLELGVNAVTEYQDRPAEKGDPWPHLLVERRLVSHPRIASLQRVPFGISYRLIRSSPVKSAGWDDRRHTAQFLLYLTVQNAVTGSPGFGDYLWFGVPMYDARYRLPRPHAARDQGSEKKKATGKFIYNPGGERYATRPASDGDWVTIDTDLLTLMKEALAAAWKAGFLPDSQRPEDYHLGGINCGWEVTGTIDAAMQIRALRLTAVA
jgi:hypothetical protein